MSEENKVGFFREDNGNKSWMRLNCFVALLVSILFGYLTIQKGDAAGDGLLITIGFLVAAFAPKAVQKFAETNVLKR